MFDLAQNPHRRYNPLTREWVLVSPHRTERPWQGQIEKSPQEGSIPYDAGCYLCPGNRRAGGAVNPHYEHTYVFDNDFPALLPDTPQESLTRDNLLIAEGEPGLCRVVCFSPRHDLTLSRMIPPEIERVIETWTQQYLDLSARSAIRHIQIFENRGAMMGCSNPHPHCQIWANATIPNEPGKEILSQQAYFNQHGMTLLQAYANLESRLGERVVFEDEHFLVVVPFWAIWPFETLVLSRRPLSHLNQLSAAEAASLAWTLKRIATRYDNLFQVDCPYSMGIHQQPVHADSDPALHLHFHFYPPLLRSAAVKKFMVGYEMLATPQRDITPENAAGRLRELPDRHYRDDATS